MTESTVTISCRDISGLDCPHALTAESADDAIFQFRDHCRNAHPEMTRDAQTEADDNIRDMF